MAIIEKRIEELGIELPNAPSPMANYMSVSHAGNMLYFSGSGAFQDGKPVVFGKLGAELSIDDGYQASRLAALNLISVMKREIGDLDKVSKIVKLLGFVASTTDFVQQPAVLNGASDVLIEIFKESGKHARTAVAVPVLPFNIPVEIEMIVELK